MPAVTRQAGSINLLDVDPDLAWRLREDDRGEARGHLRLPVIDIPPGPWSPATATDDGHPFGLIVAEGAVMREVRLGGRSTLQLLGPGDLILEAGVADTALLGEVRWHAATACRVAVMDEAVQGTIALWPGLALGLLDRAGQQLARACAETAIAQLPKVAERLEATFWQLAERWGRVTPSGIHVPLTLSHEVLARLVGGRRPTISLAVTELAERGILIRHPDRTWLIIARTSTLDTAAPPVVIKDLQVREPEPPHEPPLGGAWTSEAAAALLSQVAALRQASDEKRRRVAEDLARSAEIRARSQALHAALAHRREEATGRPERRA